jgi:hypothetical protein
MTSVYIKYWKQRDHGTFPAVLFDLSGTTDTVRSPNNSVEPFPKLFKLDEHLGTPHITFTFEYYK